VSITTIFLAGLVTIPESIARGLRFGVTIAIFCPDQPIHKVDFPLRRPQTAQNPARTLFLWLFFSHHWSLFLLFSHLSVSEFDVLLAFLILLHYSLLGTALHLFYPHAQHFSSGFSMIRSDDPPLDFGHRRRALCRNWLQQNLQECYRPHTVLSESRQVILRRSPIGISGRMTRPHPVRAPHPEPEALLRFSASSDDDPSTRSSTVAMPATVPCSGA